MRFALITLLILISGGIGFFLGRIPKEEKSTAETSGPQWQFSDAASRGDIKQMEALYTQGIDIDALPKFAGGDGYRALWIAVVSIRPQATDWLLAHGANPELHSGESTPHQEAINRLKQAQQILASIEKKTAEQGAAANP